MSWKKKFVRNWGRLGMKFNRYALSDLATIKYGKNQKKVLSESGNIPIYGTGGLMGYATIALYDKPSVLIGRKGSIGKVKYVEHPFWTVDTLFYTIVNTDIVLPKYLYYVMSLIDLNNYNEGTTIPSLRTETLNRIEFDIPSLVEQESIVSCLNPIDEKIALNNAINNNLEQQAQALFKSWFVDFEPFGESFIDSPIETKIPHSLQMVQIGSLPHILETGKRPKGGAVATGVPSIGAENVKRLGEVNFTSAKYIPVEFAQKMDKGKVHGYELMLYKDGGKPGTFIPHFSMFGEGFPYDDFFINEHVFKLDFGDKGFNEFCYFYLQTDYPYNWLANNGGKAAVPGINQQDVNSIWIYHPDNPLVKEYCKWVQPIFTTILKNCSQNVKLSQLRDALLPKLMSGELDVSNIEI